MADLHTVTTLKTSEHLAGDKVELALSVLIFGPLAASKLTQCPRFEKSAGNDDDRPLINIRCLPYEMDGIHVEQSKVEVRTSAYGKPEILKLAWNYLKGLRGLPGTGGQSKPYTAYTPDTPIQGDGILVDYQSTSDTSQTLVNAVRRVVGSDDAAKLDSDVVLAAKLRSYDEGFRRRQLVGHATADNKSEPEISGTVTLTDLVTLLADYPTLLRDLGLIVDYTVQIPTPSPGFTAPVAISTRVTIEAAGQHFDSDEKTEARTLLSLGDGRDHAVLQPRRSGGGASPYVENWAGVRGELVDTCQWDVEATVRNLGGRLSPEIVRKEGLPEPKPIGAGVVVAWTKKAELRKRFTSSMNRPEGEPAFFDDCVRGLVPAIRDTKDTEWHSLTARHCIWNGPDFKIEWDDEAALTSTHAEGAIPLSGWLTIVPKDEDITAARIVDISIDVLGHSVTVKYDQDSQHIAAALVGRKHYFSTLFVTKSGQEYKLSSERAPILCHGAYGSLDVLSLYEVKSGENSIWAELSPDESKQPLTRDVFMRWQGDSTGRLNGLLKLVGAGAEAKQWTLKARGLPAIRMREEAWGGGIQKFRLRFVGAEGDELKFLPDVDGAAGRLPTIRLRFHAKTLWHLTSGTIGHGDGTSLVEGAVYEVEVAGLAGGDTAFSPLIDAIWETDLGEDAVIEEIIPNQDIAKAGPGKEVWATLVTFRTASGRVFQARVVEDGGQQSTEVRWRSGRKTLCSSWSVGGMRILPPANVRVQYRYDDYKTYAIIRSIELSGPEPFSGQVFRSTIGGNSAGDPLIAVEEDQSSALPVGKLKARDQEIALSDPSASKYVLDAPVEAIARRDEHDGSYQLMDGPVEPNQLQDAFVLRLREVAGLTRLYAHRLKVFRVGADTRIVNASLGEVRGGAAFFNPASPQRFLASASAPAAIVEVYGSGPTPDAIVVSEVKDKPIEATKKERFFQFRDTESLWPVSPGVAGNTSAVESTESSNQHHFDAYPVVVFGSGGVKTDGEGLDAEDRILVIKHDKNKSFDKTALFKYAVAGLPIPFVTPFVDALVVENASEESAEWRVDEGAAKTDGEKSISQLQQAVIDDTIFVWQGGSLAVPSEGAEIQPDEGESLASIATRFGVDPWHVVALNCQTLPTRYQSDIRALSEVLPSERTLKIPARQTLRSAVIPGGAAYIREIPADYDDLFKAVNGFSLKDVDLATPGLSVFLPYECLEHFQAHHDERPPRIDITVSSPTDADWKKCPEYKAGRQYGLGLRAMDICGNYPSFVDERPPGDAIVQFRPFASTAADRLQRLDPMAAPLLWQTAPDIPPRFARKAFSEQDPGLRQALHECANAAARYLRLGIGDAGERYFVGEILLASDAIRREKKLQSDLPARLGKKIRKGVTLHALPPGINWKQAEFLGDLRGKPLSRAAKGDDWSSLSAFLKHRQKADADRWQVLTLEDLPKHPEGRITGQAGVTPYEAFEVHVVKEGDTLVGLARRYGVDPWHIALCNKEEGGIDTRMLCGALRSDVRCLAIPLVKTLQVSGPMSMSGFMKEISGTHLPLFKAVNEIGEGEDLAKLGGGIFYNPYESIYQLCAGTATLFKEAGKSLPATASAIRQRFRADIDEHRRLLGAVNGSMIPDALTTAMRAESLGRYRHDVADPYATMLLLQLPAGCRTATDKRRKPGDPEFVVLRGTNVDESGDSAGLLKDAAKPVEICFKAGDDTQEINEGKAIQDFDVAKESLAGLLDKSAEDVVKASSRRTDIVVARDAESEVWLRGLPHLNLWDRFFRVHFAQGVFDPAANRLTEPALQALLGMLTPRRVRIRHVTNKPARPPKLMRLLLGVRKPLQTELRFDARYNIHRPSTGALVVQIAVEREYVDSKDSNLPAVPTDELVRIIEEPELLKKLVDIERAYLKSVDDARVRAAMELEEADAKKPRLSKQDLTFYGRTNDLTFSLTDRVVDVGLVTAVYPAAVGQIPLVETLVRAEGKAADTDEERKRKRAFTSPTRDEENFRFAYDLQDARHRTIFIRGVALSRYGREVFGDELTQTSPETERGVVDPTDEWRRVDVAATKRPDEPLVSDVTVVFHWSDGHGTPDVNWSRGMATNWFFSRERLAGHRIWLDRPWYSSGSGEKLAVLCWMDANIPEDAAEEHIRLVSRWGADPVFETGMSVASGLLTRDRFLHVWASNVGLKTGVTGAPSTKDTAAAAQGEGSSSAGLLNEAGRLIPVGIVAYSPRFHPEERQWYCDIFADARTYTPFVSLSVARYQPYAIEDCALSYARRLKPLQILPKRTLNVAVRFDGSIVLEVRLSGIFPPQNRRQIVLRVERNPYVDAMGGQITREDVARQELGWEPIKILNIDGASVFEIVLDNPDASRLATPDPGYEPNAQLITARISCIPPSSVHDPRADTENGRSSHPCYHARLTVCEYEVFPAARPMLEGQIEQRRIVYSDQFLLPQEIMRNFIAT